MLFLKNNLSGNAYNWPTSEGDSVYTSAPDRRSFDRLNGDHVLYMINFFGSSIGKLTLNTGHKIEELILKHLPLELKSRFSVFNWLRGRYLYSWGQNQD